MATPTSSTSTVTRELTQEQWEKAVCALFTNVKLYDRGALHPAVKGIKHILANTKYTTSGLTPTNGSNFWFYHTSVTALYEMNREGVIVDVFFNDREEPKKHAEENFLESLNKRPRSVHSIGLNYSPCTIEGPDCARKIVEEYKGTKKPEIHFSQVYTNEEQKDKEGIKLLIRNGFELKVLKTDKIFKYLLDQCPDKPKHEVEEAYESTTGPRDTRDDHIQGIIDECEKKN